MQAQKLLKRVEERELYSCTANIRIPEIKVDMDCSECRKRICLDQEVRLNLKVIEKLRIREKEEKEKFLKDVWKKFRGEEQSELELSHVKEKLWLEVRTFNHIKYNKMLIHAMNYYIIRL
jgi:hypothetical protein